LTVTAADVVVVGGGITGLAVAAWLSDDRTVQVLEAEATVGHHATGRSVAQYLEHYGGPVNERLTRASRPYFDRPPPEDVEVPLLSPRPLLTVGSADQTEQLAALVETGGGALEALDAREALAWCPGLRPEWLGGAVLDPDGQDLDVMALHGGFRRRLLRQGGALSTGARVSALERSGGLWRATTAVGTFEAPVVVDAAGAWADQVAVLAGVAPVGLQPLRRTALVVPVKVPVLGWPLVEAVDGSCYAKPEGPEALVCSPADETPSVPVDARPEPEDVARALERLRQLLTVELRSVRHAWAGLRSFVADRQPVIGPDEVPGFFWLAGVGGTGIQSAPALGQLAAALVRGEPPPAGLGVSAAEVAPGRCRA